MPLYEVMFDKPQVVTDSFIVAGTENNNDGSYAIETPPNTELSQRMWLWDKRPTRYWSVNYWYNPNVVGVNIDLGIGPGQNVLWYKYRNLHHWQRTDPWTA